MDFLNILFTIILSAIALGVIVIRSLKNAIRNVMIEEGIIRPLRAGSSASHWPNGYRNLPDTLEGLSDQLYNHLERDED